MQIQKPSCTIFNNYFTIGNFPVIESSCKIFHMEMSLICVKMNLSGEHFDKTRFDTEVKQNSEMAYSMNLIFDWNFGQVHFGI